MAGGSARSRWEANPKRSSKRYVELAKPVTVQSSESLGVLLMDEAAHRLGLIRQELERMVKAGKVGSVPMAGGFGVVIPLAEVERLQNVSGS